MQTFVSALTLEEKNELLSILQIATVLQPTTSEMETWKHSRATAARAMRDRTGASLFNIVEAFKAAEKSKGE